MNVRFINEHNEIVNEPNEIMVVHDISSQKTLQSGHSNLIHHIGGRQEDLLSASITLTILLDTSDIFQTSNKLVLICVG